MIYIQRDPVTGEVIGIYRNPQPQPDGTCLTDPVPVAEDDPLVMEYVQRIAVLQSKKK